MSFATVSIILERIKSATPNSQIAVFKDRCMVDGVEHPDRLNAVFEQTIETRRRIANRDTRLIGVFSNDEDPEEVKKILQAAINK